MVSHENVTTAFELPGYRVARNHGVVRGIIVRSRSLFGTIGAGLQTTNAFWLIGATHYDHSVGQSFYGWLGDVRIVNRPLRVNEFMIARD